MKLAPLFVLSAIAVLAAGTEPKVKLPAGRADMQRGEKLFQVHCARCHGAKGDGSRGPSLTRPKLPRAPDDAALVRVIEDGIRGTEMPGAGAMDDREIRQVAAYVRSLGKAPMKPVPGDPAHGAGIPLLSQTVLLKGVNDDAESMAALMRALVANRIKPYYLHHPDLAAGTAHFRLPLERGQDIVREMRGRISGLCQPTYVLDIPGGFGKVPAGPSYLESNTEGGYRVTDWQGGIHAYPSPGDEAADIAATAAT